MQEYALLKILNITMKLRSDISNKQKQTQSFPNQIFDMRLVGLV